MKKESKQKATLDRRKFLGGIACAAGATALGGCEVPDFIESALRKHFHKMSSDEIADMLEDLEHKYSRKYDREISVGATPPQENVLFGYALDIARCIGCRRCVYACVDENNQSRDPQIQWITVLELESAQGVDLEHSTPYYDVEQVPRPGKIYLPVACQHCENPPCVRVCPVKATWKDEDGIVVIDYDWCIGCRCCMSACPYGARHFNWKEPSIPADEINPDTEYLGNRPRPRGVVEKCSFCLQRVRKGRYPACVEVCPVGARKFGNLLDPESDVRYILENKSIFILKKDLATKPKFFYYWGT